MSVKFTCNSSIMTDEKLSRSAKWFYVVISYLYSKYGFKTGYFYRTNEQMLEDAGISPMTLKSAKKELLKLKMQALWLHL